MVLIIAYLLSNIVISYFLERKKWRAAVISHAVLFTMLLCALFLVSRDETAAFMTQRVLGEEVYDAIMEALYTGVDSGTQLIIPLLTITGSFILMSVAAGAIVAKKVIDAVRLCRRMKAEKRSEEKVVYSSGSTKAKSAKYRIYLKNCSLLC